MNINLAPAQKKSLEKLVEFLPNNNVFVLSIPPGFGKTTMLKALSEKTKSIFLDMADFLRIHQEHHPLSLEESLERWLMNALSQSDLVLVDDLHLLDNVMGSLRQIYPRCGMLDIALEAVCSRIANTKKKIVFAHTLKAPSPIDRRCFYIGFDKLEVEDYRFLCSLFLGEENAAKLDFERIHRFAPRLNVYKIQTTCQSFQNRDYLTTDAFIQFLATHHLASNISVVDGETVEFKDLKGVSQVIQALETHIILPLENDSLVKEMDLKPKKGVLLYGPPGSGKTSIGRALAHRMKGKFFLIDGTFISTTPEFYQRVQEVFESAKQNAPSIIFIDDSDVIWENSYETGLYRYLLTELDGLAGSQSRICVMMAAMDVVKIPPALVRSGRLELWLELSLPDETARQEILQLWIDKLPPFMSNVDIKTLSRNTEGFSGADLRRIPEDAKNLYAYDRAHQNTLLPVTEYFLSAIKTIRQYRQKKTEAEEKLKSQKMMPFPLLFSPEMFTKMAQVDPKLWGSVKE